MSNATAVARSFRVPSRSVGSLRSRPAATCLQRGKNARFAGASKPENKNDWASEFFAENDLEARENRLEFAFLTRYSDLLGEFGQLVRLV